MTALSLNIGYSLLLSIITHGLNCVLHRLLIYSLVMRRRMHGIFQYTSDGRLGVVLSRGGWRRC
jgi:hypothetical protein